MDRSLGVGVVFVLAGALLVAAPAPGSATGTAGFKGGSSAASQVTAAKTSSKGTLRISVTGSGSYTITGKGFRKSGHAAKAYKVKAGRYLVKAPGAVVKPGKVRVRAGKTVRVRVTFPASTQTPPVTVTPTPSPKATTPAPPPPSADVVLSRQVSLPPGSAAIVDLSPQLASLTSLTGGATDGPVSWAVDSGGLTVSVAAGTAPGSRQVVATGVGCVSEDDCAHSVSVSIGVTVQPLQAPPNVELTAVVPPSPDRVAQAQNVSEGLDVLTDEATIVVEAPDPATGRLVADAAASAVGAVVVSGLSEALTFQLRWTDRQDIKARLAALAALPGVRSAEAGLLADVTGNEVGAGDEPAYGGDPWNMVDVNAAAAWDEGITGSGITIAILEVPESGGQKGSSVSAHEDLPDVSYPAGPKGPVSEHATHVAGLACAKDNGKGVIGVAPGCTLASVPAESFYVNGYLNTFTKLVKAGVRVMNNSWGQPLGCEPLAGEYGSPPTYYHACGQADLAELQKYLKDYTVGNDNGFSSWLRTTGRDTVFVVSAGNKALPESTNLWSQMAVRGGAQNVVTVASTDRNGGLSYFSNFGPNVDLAAPGGGLLSTLPGNKYGKESGTSMAAPMVSGAAALIMQKYPGLDGAQIATCLISSSNSYVTQRNDKGDLNFPFTGRIHRLDVGSALHCGIDPPAHPKTANTYIARDPATGRSVLVDRGTVHVIRTGTLFNCLARTRAVWDIPDLKVLKRPADPTQIACYDEGPEWTYTPTAQGGNTGTNIILRDTSTTPHSNYLINSAGEIQAITDGDTYLCLAASNPVIWNVPKDKINAWTPVGVGPASCGGGAIRPVTIAAGALHTCALDTAGKAWCWGADVSGAVGDGNNDRVDKDTPVAVAGDHTFTTITAGGYHTCALDTSGKAWCWGQDYEGQIGDGTDDGNQGAAGPVAVAGDHTFTTIAAGHYHTCALDTSGKAWCWGRDYYGQIGDGSDNQGDKYVPVAVAGDRTYTTITAGGPHTCALDTAGIAWCWGWDGTGSGNQKYFLYSPVAVAGDRAYATITVGQEHTCALDTIGMAWCWGLDHDGEVGDGSDNQGDKYVPVAVAGDRAYAVITAGDGHTCALDTAGKAWCWGRDYYGEVGDGSDNQGDKYVPVAVAGDRAYAVITAGGGHTCALDTAGKAWCWGRDYYGEVGDGSDNQGDKYVPVAVAGDRTYQQS